MFTHAKLQKGETVLILGGSSAVGMYAVQFAHAIGAYVITTASAEKAEFVKSLGADQVIDYRTEKWLDVVKPHSVDAFYNCGMENAAWNEGAQVVLKKNTGASSRSSIPSRRQSSVPNWSATSMWFRQPRPCTRLRNTSRVAMSSP